MTVKRKRVGPEYWVKNLTSNDLVSTELKVRVLAKAVVNLGKLNPQLTDEQLQQSEASGFLFKTLQAKKLAKVPFAPREFRGPEYQVSTVPIETRVNSSVMVDQKEKDFIEELTRFDDEIASGGFGDGFVDPMADSGPAVVVGETGEGFGDQNQPFSAVVVKPGPEFEPPKTKHRAKAAIKRSGNTMVLDVEEAD